MSAEQRLYFAPELRNLRARVSRTVARSSFDEREESPGSIGQGAR